MGDDELLFPVGTPIPVEEEFEVPDPPRPEIPDPTIPLPFTPLTGAIFSPCRTYRYLLWRQFLEVGKTCLMIGVNPSTANENDNDNTITREENFSKAWGCAMLLKANLFAWCATDPKEMRKAWKLGSNVVGPDNDRHILESAAKADIIVCAWGNNGGFKKRDSEVIELLKNYSLKALKFTKSGKPRHTLYLPNGLVPIPFVQNEEEFVV